MHFLSGEPMHYLSGVDSKLADGDGLHLLVSPNGSKLWRLRYRFGGKQNMIDLGAFPEITLATTRDKRHDARKLVAEGIDPSQQRKAEKVATTVAANNTFGAIVTDYIQKLRDEGKAESTIEKNEWLLQDLASPLTHRPITEIKPFDLLDLLKKIEKSGRRDTARRLRGTIGSVFRYAIVTLARQQDAHLTVDVPGVYMGGRCNRSPRNGVQSARRKRSTPSPRRTRQSLRCSIPEQKRAASRR